MANKKSNPLAGYYRAPKMYTVIPTGGKYYNDDEASHDLDELDNQIWDSIDKFVNVCEQFYLGRGTK